MSFSENMTYNDSDDQNDFKNLTIEKQNILLDWCDLIGKTTRINEKHTSYGLKHIFEKSQSGFYITNGMFKGAMLKLGYKYKQCHPSSPNWFFNISEKGVKFLLNQNRTKR
nr:MAG TPA: hypothetical protein [Caudoviricetes sp.]